MGFVMWLNAVTRQEHFVCVHPHESVSVCSCVEGSRWLEHYYHRPMDSALGWEARLCSLQQRQYDTLSLSPPLCLFFLLSPRHQMDEWLSLSVSSHSALSSSVSLLAHSFLCRISDLSLTPAIPQSSHPFCPLDEYLSLRHLFFPFSIHPSIPQVFCLSVCSKGNLHGCVCVFYCISLKAMGVCVSLSARSLSVPPPLGFPPLLCLWRGCESRSVGICWQTPTVPSMPPSLPHTHTHPEGLYVFCPSNHLYVPAMPVSAQFSTAQLGSMD